MRFFTLRPPARLGTRIAAMTLIALLAVQALNAAAFFLLPPPPMSVYGARWLVEKVEETVPAIFAAAKTDRPLLAEQTGAQYNLRSPETRTHQIRQDMAPTSSIASAPHSKKICEKKCAR